MYAYDSVYKHFVLTMPAVQQLQHSSRHLARYQRGASAPVAVWAHVYPRLPTLLSFINPVALFAPPSAIGAERGDNCKQHQQ